MADPRRVYYDHEHAYRKIAQKGGRGWDDIRPNPQNDSYVALEKFLASPFAPAPGTRALELGCGGGQASLRLARQGYRASGIDFSETAIELARTNAREAQLEVHFHVDDCLKLSTQENQSLGLVIDQHALHCIIGSSDRAAFLAAAFRVLAPGGLFFTDTMSCLGDWRAQVMKADPATRIALNNTRFWVSDEELDLELESAGFTILHREQRHDADPPGTGDMLVRVAERPKGR